MIMPYTRMVPENVEPSVRKEYLQMMTDTELVTRYKCPVCGKLEEEGEWGLSNGIM